MHKHEGADLRLTEMADVAPEPRTSEGNPALASHSRHMGDYVYDIEVHRTTSPNAGRCCGHVLNMRAESGETVSINADLQLAYGATPYEAFAKIEAAVAKWVKDLARSH